LRFRKRVIVWCVGSCSFVTPAQFRHRHGGDARSFGARFASVGVAVWFKRLRCLKFRGLVERLILSECRRGQQKQCCDKGTDSNRCEPTHGFIPEVITSVLILLLCLFPTIKSILCLPTQKRQPQLGAAVNGICVVVVSGVVSSSYPDFQLKIVR
jgi:hypothetical protein